MDATKSCLPQALIVFDKFHIVRHLLQAVDQLRKEEVRSLEAQDCDRLQFLNK
jgi:transposase